MKCHPISFDEFGIRNFENIPSIKVNSNFLKNDYLSLNRYRYS